MTEHMRTGPKVDRFVPSGAASFDLMQSNITRDYYFILLPKMTMLAFSAAVEPLRIANQLTGQCLYRWHLLSEDGAPIICSNGVSIAVDRPLHQDQNPISRHDTIIVCSGLDGYLAASPKTLDILRRHHRQGGQLGGICTGAYTLARAGLLANRRITLHWENQPAFEEHFPHLDVSAQIFEIDRGIITCGGGAASTDMMLATIEADHGPRLTRMVMDMCVHGGQRRAGTRQKSSIATAIDSRNRRLIRLVRHMHENIEDPLSLVDLALLEGISKRQMERLFKRYLNVCPSQYYKNIRIDFGHSLIVETDMTVTEISIASGFSTSSVFSRYYKKRFGNNPSRAF